MPPAVVTETSRERRLSKNILSAGDLNGLLTLIGPGSDLVPSESSLERVLYLAQGSVTASFSSANYILNADETLVVPAGRKLAIRNHGDAPAKLLVISLPSPRRVESPIVRLS